MWLRQLQVRPRRRGMKRQLSSCESPGVIRGGVAPCESAVDSKWHARGADSAMKPTLVHKMRVSRI